MNHFKLRVFDKISSDVFDKWVTVKKACGVIILLVCSLFHSSVLFQMILTRKMEMPFPSQSNSRSQVSSMID